MERGKSGGGLRPARSARTARASMRASSAAGSWLPGPYQQVFIETVDSFQGKQLDVVILSCVRASTSGGLGESCGCLVLQLGLSW